MPGYSTVITETEFELNRDGTRNLISSREIKSTLPIEGKNWFECYPSNKIDVFTLVEYDCRPF